MHACSDWLRPEIQCHAQAASVFPALLFWKWHNSQGIPYEHWGMPPTMRNGHRPNRSGHRPSMELSAINNWSIGTWCSRPAKASCRTCFDSSRGQNKAWQCILSKYVHQYTPYHVYDSKGDSTRFLDHQSRISMRDGPRNQVVHFHVKWNANQIST